MRTALLALVGAAGLAASANADVLAHWTFETSIPTTAGPHAAEAGVFAATSFASGSHVLGATVYSNPAGNGSPESFSSNNWSSGDYYEFETSTAGYNTILLSWSQTRSSTGPADFSLFASGDGTTYVAVGFNYAVLENSAVNGGAWNMTTHIASYDFGGSVGGADNLPILGFRLVCNVTTASAGTNRVDDFKLEGTLIPAPGALAVLGLGGLVAGRRRR